MKALKIWWYRRMARVAEAKYQAALTAWKGCKITTAELDVVGRRACKALDRLEIAVRGRL